MDKIPLDNGAVRNTEGKAPIHLLEPEILLALAEHSGKGTAVYGERNWQRGMEWHKCYNSMMRHALAWWGGQDKDQENGSSHLIAVIWNAAALYWYTIKGVGVDDRPKYAADFVTFTEVK